MNFRSCFFLSLLPLSVAAQIPPAAAPPSEASTEPVQLDAYRVAGSYTGLDPKPATTSSVVSGAEAQTYNVVAVEDALKYLPNLAFRRRFVGDLNSGVGIRGTQHAMTARTIVNVDGLLLSNFLGNGLVTSPRWSLVAPEEIERSELIYGPYSALYSGNSLGGIINLTTKSPELFQSDAKATWFFHAFKEYGSDDTFMGNNYAVSVGDRCGAFSYFIFYNRLRNESHPLDYRQKIVATQTTAAAPASTATPVTGIFRDPDLTNADRFVYGETGPTETSHDLVKLKLGYDISADTHLHATLAWWGNDEDRLKPASYVFDAAGQPVFSGPVQFAGRSFTIAAGTPGPLAASGLPTLADFNISYRHRENLLSSLSGEHRFASGWEISALGSAYRVLDDVSRASVLAAPAARSGGAGQVTLEGDSGWNTADVKLASPQLAGGHALIAGYHYDGYFGETDQFNATDWRDAGTRTLLTDGSYGKTGTQALFVQDAWQLAPAWKLTAGLRGEHWRAHDGVKARDLSAGNRQRTAIPARSASDLSPKGTLAFRPAPTSAWELRASLARAVRYPTEGELFQGSVSSTGLLTRSDPNLRPEVGFSKDLTAERRLAGGAVRLSVFEDTVKDTLFSQLNVATQITNYQNIAEVRTRGAEASYEKRRFLFSALDLYANATLTDARILRNDTLPASNGKVFPRIPRNQAKILLTLHPAAAWVVTAGARYSSDPYYNLDNSDSHDTYGGIGGYLLAETKVSWHGPRGFTLSLGVDNLTNDLYHVAHPIPMRTTFLEAQWKY